MGMDTMPGAAIAIREATTLVIPWVAAVEDDSPVGSPAFVVNGTPAKISQMGDLSLSHNG